MLAAALRHEALRFLACSGATTDDVVLRQVPDLPADARLVTITVGGDDVGFAAVLTACSAGGTQEACTTAINTALTALGNLPNKLGLTYNAIHRQAPQAKLVVLGYPHIFGSGSCTAPGLPPLPARAAIDAGTDALDKVIAEVTGASGATYVDVRGRFQDHGTCAGPLRRWINAPTQPISESYHPNALGHALGYLPALLAVQAPLAV